jgi:hypothetical protein
MDPPGDGDAEDRRVAWKGREPPIRTTFAVGLRTDDVTLLPPRGDPVGPFTLSRYESGNEFTPRSSACPLVRTPRPTHSRVSLLPGVAINRFCPVRAVKLLKMSGADPPPG